MKMKKLLLIVFVAFLLFWLFQDPSGMAAALESLFTKAWDLCAGFFDSVLSFVRELG
ncbi:hypothetical protein [Nocardioides yefusunii]|uniref:Uncharacterized protein n=1 Tax=Nocardioides yefusunii TaxID=2500546 RepID=A0ABW1QYQ2_9ACTN|nr:hypothetical protein [Nocardioides yefusunii]